MPSICVQNLHLSYPLFGRKISQSPPKQIETAGANKDESASTLAGSTAPNTTGDANNIKALRGISFKLTAGDRLGIVGRNGSGKSTLLRVLAGIYEPSRGLVKVDGKLASLFAVGLGVRPEATGRRNIILRGIVHGLSRSDVEAKVKEIAEFSELGSYIDMPVRTYSAGMAMRLAFSAATAFSADILLLDEWIGAGDENFQKKATQRMKSLVDGAGITVIASHNRNLLTNVCTHGLWLDGGVQRAFGPIREVITEMAQHY